MSEVETAPAGDLLPVPKGRAALPSVEALASMIAGTDEPDAKTMAIARVTHSRLVTRALKDAPTCSSCIHHTVSSFDTPVMQCLHPAIAETTREVTQGNTRITIRRCDTERKDAELGSHGRITLCGVEGRLHEPLKLPWVFSVTRALIRKTRAEW